MNFSSVTTRECGTQAGSRAIVATISLFALICSPIPVSNSLAQEAVPGQAVVGDGELSVKYLLSRHEAQRRQLRTADVSWSVTYRNANAEPTTEKLQTIVTPQLQATTRWLPSGDPFHSWWDGERFGQISRFDPHQAPVDDQVALRVNATLYQSDLPIQRLFGWRTVQDYRFFASDSDLSLRQLCEQSPTEPAILHNGDLIRLVVGHPGQEPGNGTPEIPAGTPIEIDLDPAHGYLIKRHKTTLDLKEDADLNVSGGVFWQILEVQEFEEPQDGLFVPIRVKYSLGSEDENVSSEQDIRFEFSKVNESFNIDRLRFLPNMLVTELTKYGADEPLGYHIVDGDLDLGLRYASHAVAGTMRRHQLGLIDDETLESSLAILRSVPEVGMQAPQVSGLGLESGNAEKFKYEGRVTAVEFWSTSCGPCQGAMTKFDELAAEISDKWSDEVQFVTVSLDEDIETVRRHVKERGWSHTRLLVDSLLEEPTKSATFPFVNAKKFVVTAIPTCLVIDQQGQIVYRGNLFDEQVGAEIRRLVERDKTGD